MYQNFNELCLKLKKLGFSKNPLNPIELFFNHNTYGKIFFNDNGYRLNFINPNVNPDNFNCRVFYHGINVVNDSDFELQVINFATKIVNHSKLTNDLGDCWKC